MGQDIEKEARCAANWWAQILRNPKMDMGAAQPQEKLCEFLASKNATQTLATAGDQEEQYAAFEESLARRIQETRPYCIGVDLTRHRFI